MSMKMIAAVPAAAGLLAGCVMLPLTLNLAIV